MNGRQYAHYSQWTITLQRRLITKLLYKTVISARYVMMRWNHLSRSFSPVVRGADEVIGTLSAASGVGESPVASSAADTFLRPPGTHSPCVTTSTMNRRKRSRSLRGRCSASVDVAVNWRMCSATDMDFRRPLLSSRAVSAFALPPTVTPAVGVGRLRCVSSPLTLNCRPAQLTALLTVQSAVALDGYISKWSVLSRSNLYF